MTPHELKKHKSAPKAISEEITFSNLKKGRLPKPFKRMGGRRLFATKILDLTNNYAAIFLYRDGEILTDTAFFGYLMLRIPDNDFYPILEFHWHPSHKGFHIKLPCNTSLDYTNRMLPNAPELNIKTKPTIDPRIANDRFVLIDLFCELCDIKVLDPNDPNTNLL